MALYATDRVDKSTIKLLWAILSLPNEYLVLSYSFASAVFIGLNFKFIYFENINSYAVLAISANHYGLFFLLVALLWYGIDFDEAYRDVTKPR